MTDSKKIGILTLHRSDNYGAMLQAYALSKFLKDIGYKPFIVNYHMEAASLGTYLRKPLVFFSKVVGKGALSWSFFKSKLSEKRGDANKDEFSQVFEDFREEYLNITQDVYDYKLLKVDAPDAYAFIVGSDQVWAADFVFSSPAFLLAFAKHGVKKISYAASFGKAELEGYLQPVFKANITTFDAISVREESGVALIDNLAKVRATHVVDPTLLLTDYSEIIDYSLVPEEEYVFSYRLGQADDLTHWMNEALHEIVASKGLSHYVVSTNSEEGAITTGEFLRPTPGQLLGLIERAALFVTNSFHGTVFAMLLRTEFLTFARDSSPNKQNLRLIELLSRLGLSDRYCAPRLCNRSVLEKAVSVCDFDTVFYELAELRQMSSSFLKQALEE